MKGSIHGRFQPFHNGHLQYALEALRHTTHLYVGLTKVLTEPGRGEKEAPHRSQLASNPFYYRERVNIIRGALFEAGIPAERFSIGPFPIENPDRLHEFWAFDDICYTTLVDDWNHLKVELLERAGFRTVSLKQGAWLGDQLASGTRIRELIRADDPAWRKFVPTGAVAEIEKILSQRAI